MDEKTKTGATGAQPEDTGAQAQSGANPDVGNAASENKEVSTAEFQDATEKNNPGVEKKKEDGRSAENARRRREAERKAELEKARDDAIIENVGVNPYTNEPIKTHADVMEYITMQGIAKGGGDPVTDYHKAVKEKIVQDQQKKEEEKASEEWFKSDREEFSAKHPEVNLGTLIDDKHFRMYADGKVGRVPLSQIYESYQTLLEGFKNSAQRQAAQAAANAAASPGALAESATATEKDFFTKEEVEKMSKQEVARNLDKIRASMTKWKF